MAARRLKGSWWVDFRYERRRYREKSPIDTKRGAEEHERLRRNELASAQTRPTPSTSAEPTKEVISVGKHLDEWVRIYAQANNKQSEIDSKKRIIRLHLAPAFGRHGFDINWPLEVERFKAGLLEQGKSPKTVNNCLTVLRKALASAFEWGRLAAVPPIKWLKTEKPGFDFFTSEESDRLLAVLSGQPRVIVALALKAGLRRGELLALRWEDVDLHAGKLLVRQSVYRGQITSPKNRRMREVPLAASLAAELRAHRHLRGQFVLCQEDGAMLTRDMVKRIVPAACKRAGLRLLQWHALRHSFASQLAMAGVPVAVIKDLLGHATIEMTMRYAHLAPAVHREAIERLDSGATFSVYGGHQVGTNVKNGP